MDVVSWICGLMRENSDAVGFIPSTSIDFQYVRRGHFVIQEDESGQPVGYLLHGPIRPGKPCVVSQHVIQYEKRLRGYGEMAFRELLQRCQMGYASSIHLRVADDLPAVFFWQSCGFSTLRVVPGGERRKRMIIEMYYPLALPMFEMVHGVAEAAGK